MLQLLTICILFVSAYSQTAEFVVKENRMTEEMKNLALSTTLQEINNSGHTTDSIARRLVDTFNREYGNLWFSLVTRNNVSTQIRVQDRTLLRFTYGDIYVQLFKPAFLTHQEVISHARLSDATIRVNVNEMSEEMKVYSQVISTIAIKTFNNFHSISQNITKVMNLKYGREWNAVVGEMGIDINANHINGNLISFTIGELHIILYKTKYEFPDRLTEHELIIEAQNELSNAKVAYNEMSIEMADFLISSIKAAINSKTTLTSVAKSISNDMTAKYGNIWQAYALHMGGLGITNNGWTKGTYFAITIAQIDIQVFQTITSQTQTTFSEIISKARTAPMNMKFELSLNKTLENAILVTVNQSIAQDFSDCESNQNAWYDPYGLCYRKIGEYLLDSLVGYSSFGWCLTVGEIDSHWNYCTGTNDDVEVFLQFAYDRIHFNIAKYKTVCKV